MKQSITYKNLIHYFFLFIITFLIWAAVGSKYSPISNINNLNLKLILNNLRFFLPLILIIILIYYKQNYQKNLFLNVIIFTIFVSFTIGNFNLHSNNENLVEIFNNDEILIKFGYLTNFFRDIMMSIFFVSTYLIYSRLNQIETETLLKLNYLFIILTSFITLYFAYLEYFSIRNDKEYLYFTQFLVTGELYGVPTIRSLGLSRNLLIILIPLTFLSLSGKIKKYNVLLNIVIIFLCLNIFQLQSRLTIYSFIIFSVLILLYLIFNKNYKKIFYYVFIFLILPQFLNFLIPNLKSYYFNFDGKNKVKKQEETILNQNENIFTDVVDFIQTVKIPKGRIFTSTPNNPGFKGQRDTDNVLLVSEYTSGRTELWKKTLKIFTTKNNYKSTFFGFGTSADRYFLKESASSAFFYSLISGGFLGLLFLILFYLFILNLFYYFFLNRDKIKEKIVIYSVITVIIFIMLRSLVESSFLVFGTDNIILFTSLFYLQSKKLN